MFRPAIYAIEEYQAGDASSALPADKVPVNVVSMIGCYRNVARRDEAVRVSGMLERVESLSTNQVFHQVVVGTAASEEEHIWPIER
jgi:predicted nucleotidyltransferase